MSSAHDRVRAKSHSKTNNIHEQLNTLDATPIPTTGTGPAKQGHRPASLRTPYLLQEDVVVALERGCDVMLALELADPVVRLVALPTAGFSALLPGQETSRTLNRMPRKIAGHWFTD